MDHAPTRLICPLTATSLEAMRAEMDAAAKLGADMVECRLDHLVEPPSAGQIEVLLASPALPVIATCRPTRQGGLYRCDESSRLAILQCAAASGADFIDVEDDVPDSDWPVGQIILSHHDFVGVPDDLDGIAARLERSRAVVNKVAFTAAGPEDALRALDLLRVCRKPTISLAMGECGLASRILARKFGAFGTFAALGEGAGSAPGQPTTKEMRHLYHWDRLGPATAVYGVIGCPVAHSMSPAIHNAAFEAAGLDAVYLPLRIEPGHDSFSRFMDAALARGWLGLRGLSVTIPHKENALAYVGPANCGDLAGTIGAINTVTVGADGRLRGDNTDYSAAIDALRSSMDIACADLAGRSVAVLGAGGASRAIVAALAHYGARVTIYNRTVRRGQELARDFGCKSAGLEAIGGLDAEIVINCTPLGMHPNMEASPLERIPKSVRVVFDTIYNPVRTRLLRAAEAEGCLCVSGLEMFVNQAVAQFEIWTARKAPRDLMRGVVAQRLAAGE